VCSSDLIQGTNSRFNGTTLQFVNRGDNIAAEIKTDLKWVDSSAGNLQGTAVATP
jgi:hypothetical protein